MGTKTENTATAKKTRQRRRIIEKEYLNGYGPLEIFDRLPDQHKVTYGTVRKDIVEVRKAWTADIDAMDEFEGRHRYLASTRELRRLGLGDGKYDLVHTLDKEIARLSGVNLKVDDRNINLNLKAAVSHMEDILKAVFSVIHEQDEQDRIIEAIDAIAEE